MNTSYRGSADLCKFGLTIPLSRNVWEELSKLHPLTVLVWNHSLRPAMHLCQLLTKLPNGKGLSGFLNYGYEINVVGFFPLK